MNFKRLSRNADAQASLTESRLRRGVCFGGKGDVPPAPDYTGAALAQGETSQALQTAGTWANRPTQNTPWGSTFWTQNATVDPATGQKVTAWTQNQQLDPALQGALSDQLALQGQRSDLAYGFGGRVADAYSQPFNWSNLPGVAGTPQQQFTYGRDLQTQLPAYALDSSRLSQTTNPYQSVGPTGQQTGVQGYGYDLSSPQQTTFAMNEPAFTQQRTDLFNAALARMQPQHDLQTQQLQTSLANQGLTPGSQAYNMELQRLSDQQARERYNALEQSGTEQARMQQMMLGQQQQAFGQDVGAQQAQNAALAAQFGQGLQQGQFTNQALQNIFGQQLQGGQFGLQAQQQGFGQQAAQQAAYNQALAQQQQMYGNAGQFYNQAQQQLFGQDQAANAQNFQQMMAAANYQNQLRQQAIAEQMQQRAMPLNEMNALLQGQQVGSPAMPQFATAGVASAPNLLGAAQMQGQYDQNAYNAQQLGQQGLMSGLFGLGAATSKYWWPMLFGA